MGRNNEDDRQPAFLKAYARLGSIRKAAEAVELHRDTHFAWMHRDPEYAAKFKGARAEYIERMEEEADRRAVEGVQRPVFYQGMICGYTTEYSDALIMFRLRRLDPDAYRERQAVEHSGPAGGPINIKNLTDEDLEAIAASGD